MSWTEQIKKDVLRTNLSSSLRKRLQWILVEYSLWDPELGYTQGMNYTCAMIIRLFPRLRCKNLLKKFKELMRIQVSHEYTVRDMYTTGFPGLQCVLDKIRELLDKEVAQVLSDSEIEIEHFAVGWILTLFSCQLASKETTAMFKNLMKTKNFQSYIDKSVQIITKCVRESDFLEWTLLGSQFEHLLSKLKDFK